MAKGSPDSNRVTTLSGEVHEAMTEEDAIRVAIEGGFNCVFADVKFTTPSAGSTSTGGSALSIKWTDSGDEPKLSTLVSYQLFLCAGGNEDSEYIQLSTLVAQGDFKKGNTASVQIPAGIGASVQNAYFLKMISVAAGGTVNNYSPRFSLSGMTGVFPATVQAGLKNIKGTQGPATQNNIQSTQQNNPAAGGAVPAAGAGAYGQAYTLQDGPTRYAPMPPHPGTKMTADKQSMLFPTSKIAGWAKTYLPTPVAQTTITQSQTFSTQSIENTALAAGNPTDRAMQKFLERWKD
ncbi:MAG: hypothetical protein Q9227_003095 [Pyrenula ochraceoflavens]